MISNHQDIFAIRLNGIINLTPKKVVSVTEKDLVVTPSDY